MYRLYNIDVHGTDGVIVLLFLVGWCGVEGGGWVTWIEGRETGNHTIVYRCENLGYVFKGGNGSMMCGCFKGGLKSGRFLLL